jgi:hypothetical protein
MSVTGEHYIYDSVNLGVNEGENHSRFSCLHNLNSGACCTTYNAFSRVSDRIQMQAVRLKVASRGRHTFLPSLDTRPAGGVRLRVT